MDDQQVFHYKLVELGPDAFLATLRGKQLADVDEWQTEMQLKPMRAGRVQLYTTGLQPSDLADTGVEPAPSVAQAAANTRTRRIRPAAASVASAVLRNSAGLTFSA